MYRQGNTLHLTLRRCVRCHGSGRQPELSRCASCGGSGSSVAAHALYCGTCGGEGLKPSRTMTEPCGNCSGTGIATETSASTVTPQVWDTLPVRVTRDRHMPECLDHCCLITSRRVGQTGETPADDRSLAAYARNCILASVNDISTGVVDPGGAPTRRIADCLLVVVTGERTLDIYAVWGEVPLPSLVAAA